MHVVNVIIYKGYVSRHIVSGVLKSDAYHGNFKMCSFSFKDFNLDYVCALKDGERFSCRKVTRNFDINNNLEIHEALFTGNGIKMTPHNTDITRKDYANGYKVASIPFAHQNMIASDLT